MANKNLMDSWQSMSYMEIILKEIILDGIEIEHLNVRIIKKADEAI